MCQMDTGMENKKVYKFQCPNPKCKGDEYIVKATGVIYKWGNDVISYRDGRKLLDITGENDISAIDEFYCSKCGETIPAISIAQMVSWVERHGKEYTENG